MGPKRHDGVVLTATTIGRPPASPAAGLLLVAAPSLEEPFDRAVILLLEHDESGTLGVVLNQPTTLDVGTVLPNWREHLTGTPYLFQGGPVALDSALGLAALGTPTRDGVAVRAAPVEPEGFRHVAGPLGIVDLDTPSDLLAPHLQALRIYAGYAGWSPGQLDDELDRGSWAVVEPGDLVADAFLADPEQLWSAVLRRAGGTLAWWPMCPSDPEAN
jgi:putative transcriptional regulator